MGLYRRPETAFWYYEFKVEGKRHRGSTKTADRSKALAYEVERKADEQAITESSKATALNRVLWDVAQSWLEATKETHADHKGSLSRVRKLFGIEMRLIGDAWKEVSSARFGLPRALQIHQVTQETLGRLRDERGREGNSAATIEREMALIQSLFAHVRLHSPCKPAKAPANAPRQSQ